MQLHLEANQISQSETQLAIERFQHTNNESELHLDLENIITFFPNTIHNT